MTHIPVALRRQIYEQANGRCEYCRIPDRDGFISHEIDHIIAEKHGGETVVDNLCLSCWLCNRRKGTDVASYDPESGALIALFHPRHEVWSEHFGLKDAYIEPLTPQGRVTVKILQLNERRRIDERKILISLNTYP